MAPRCTWQLHASLPPFTAHILLVLSDISEMLHLIFKLYTPIITTSLMVDIREWTRQSPEIYKRCERYTIEGYQRDNNNEVLCYYWHIEGHGVYSVHYFTNFRVDTINVDCFLFPWEVHTAMKAQSLETKKVWTTKAQHNLKLFGTISSCLVESA